ncbi:MAG: hypothetical protein JO030_05370 [Candidatus Eremiobacteraeota bacterium]|nr:hypothetical protein [Candidatus Eremiobacteraeota bacterium]
MRMHPGIFALAILAGLLPATASPQVETTPIPMVVKPNFSPMQFMLGTWTCSTKSARRPAPYITTSTYSMDPSGWWINETSVTNPMRWFPGAAKITTWDKITYDSNTRRWADVSYGTPNTYGLSFSRGWSGNTITWHDVSFAPASDIASQTDTVTTKVSDTKMTSSSSFTERSGRVVGVRGVCTKH